MGKFTKSDKPTGLPEARPNKPPAARALKETERPGEQGVEDPMEAEATPETEQTPPPEAKVEEEQQQQPPKDKDEEPRVDEKGRKRNPWDLVNNYRSRNRELTKEIDDLRSKAGGDGQLPGEWKSKWELMEKRNKELEDEIGFVNYRKSKEFVDTFEKPYQTAWQEALQALSGLKVKFQRTDQETGEVIPEERDLTSHDITILAGMDPSAARQEMKARFPEDWVEVKTHVDKVRALANAQNKHLEERQSKGGEWQKARQQEQQQMVSALVAENKKVWTDTIAEHVKKYDFLRPVDGDVARNDRLEKSVAFVEEALKVNAMDPRLTPEQRREVLKKHVILRNRAIGFGVLSHENKALKGKLAELEKTLQQYQASEPGAGDGRGREGLSQEPSSLDAAAAGLLKYAR